MSAEHDVAAVHDTTAADSPSTGAQCPDAGPAVDVQQDGQAVDGGTVPPCEAEPVAVEDDRWFPL